MSDSDNFIRVGNLCACRDADGRVWIWADEEGSADVVITSAAALRSIAYWLSETEKASGPKECQCANCAARRENLS
jgi:hypothetical protein